MGRETVLFPMKWENEPWPVVEKIRGTMTGPLPPSNKRIKGNGWWAN